MYLERYVYSHQTGIFKKKPTKTNLDVEVFQSVENYRDIYVHVMRMFCLAIVWVTESFPNLLFFYFKHLQLLQVIKLFISCNLPLRNLFDRWAF